MKTFKPKYKLGPKLVSLLFKSLHGLKQSLRKWYQCIDHFLLSYGFTRLKVDANIFIKRESDQGFTILTVYVNDYIIINNKLTLVQLIKDIFQKEFKMTNEGNIHYILSNAILKNREEGCIILHQQKKLISKLEEYQMLKCNLITTLMQFGIRLSKKNCPSTSREKDLTQTYPYFQIVDNLIHADVNSRPNCTYTIKKLAQLYLSNPNITHIQSLKRIMRYIKGTLNYGIKHQQSP